jgi:NAD(P)-dependent dehydrogenase (short-subunit alcohol dehydrogenase family)
MTQVALITGGASGIGLAIAKRLMRAGAQVALADRDESALLRAAEDCLQENLRPLCLPCDITDAEACREAAARVVANWGGIDLLFNNAGLTQMGLFEKNSLEVYRCVMEVNFFGSVNMTHACLPSLLDRRGHIIVTSSVAGFAPLLGRTGYCSAKHALHGFFDTLRAELRPKGVGVTLVCPSFVATGFSEKGLSSAAGALTVAPTQTGRGLSPDEVAGIVVKTLPYRKPLLLVGQTAYLGWWASRLAPAWYERQMAKRFAAEWGRDG